MKTSNVWIDSEGNKFVQKPGEVWSNTDPRLASPGNVIAVPISKKIRMKTLLEQLQSNFQFRVKGLWHNVLVFDSRDKALEAHKWIHETNHRQYGIEAHLFDDHKLKIVISGDYVI